MRTLTILTAFFLVFSFSGVLSLNAQVYIWTDENGIKHYSDQPPEDAKDARAAFPVYEHDETADKQQTESEAQELQKVIETINEEDKKAQQEKEQQEKEADKDKQPSKADVVAAEKERLEGIIAELEKKPLEYFGSQKNKRVRIGYFKYRLEALMQDPDNYFKNPEPFEGNVKEP
jgi:alanyl-tRNA synthetase